LARTLGLHFPAHHSRPPYQTFLSASAISNASTPRRTSAINAQFHPAQLHSALRYLPPRRAPGATPKTEPGTAGLYFRLRSVAMRCGANWPQMRPHPDGGINWTVHWIFVPGPPSCGARIRATGTAGSPPGPAWPRTPWHRPPPCPCWGVRCAKQRTDLPRRINRLVH
jgi:hypothetical protein